MELKKEMLMSDQSSSSINQYIAVIICSLLPTLYGQTVGWTSTAITQLEEGGSSLPSGENGIDSSVSTWIGGAFCLGGLISSPIHGLLVDAKGRKFASYMIALCFIIEWILICFGPNMMFVLVGRAFGGAGSSGSITVPLIYNNEVAESRIRGRLGGFVALLYVFGVFQGFIIGAYVSFYTASYIYLGSSILFLLLWWTMPESPAYLLLQGKETEAKNALKWLRKCDDCRALAALEELKLQQAGATKVATFKEFFSHPASRKAVLLACILAAIQTYSGIFAVHNYAATIFGRAGGILDPFTSTIIYGGMMCVGASLPPLFVEKTGRKTMLILSCSLLSMSMAILGFYFWSVSSGVLDREIEAGGYAVKLVLALLPIVTLSISVLAFYIGLGSVIYVVFAELFLDEMRGVGGTLISIALWSTSFILLQFFSPAVALFGDHIVFFFFSTMCCLGSIFIVLFLPETRGKTPHQVVAELIKNNN